MWNTVVPIRRHPSVALNERPQMNTTKAVGHTPGPWRVQLHDKGYHLTGDHTVIGEIVTTWGLRPGEGEANARLIAAAPAMLAELREDLRVLDEALDHGYLPADTERALRNRAADLSAAIAKAEGRAA